MQDNQTVNGHWVYGAIVIPVKEIYIGMSGRKYTSQRWKKRDYKTTALQPYIEQYGWDNIHFFVFKDGLTEKQAEQLEDLLITQARLDNWCINKQGSGGKYRDNPLECRKEYDKKYREAHKEEAKQYRETHKEERKLYDKQYNKQRLSTPEYKIYNRVKNYNRNHTPIETPLEARNKYLEYGYLPSYVKNTDLK